MAPLANPPLTVAHRFVESEAGLAYYAKRPDGLMWRRKELFDTPVYYLAFHGRPAAVNPLLGRVDAEALCAAFANYGAYDNIAYFACCNVLRGEKGRRFARDFLKASGMRGGDRLRRDSGLDGLRRIFGSVRRDYPLARRLGYTLIT